MTAARSETRGAPCQDALVDWEQAEVTRIQGFESQVLDLGAMVCARHLIPAGFGSAPLYRGLPNDMCPCEHWCYLVKGQLVYTFADGGDALTVSAGEAFHLRPGHLAEVPDNTELIEFTPAEQYRSKAQHLAKSKRGT